VRRRLVRRCRAPPGQAGAAGRQHGALCPGAVLSAKSSKAVSFRLLGINFVFQELPLTENPLQGHTALYRSYPPQSDIPQPDHFLPSAAAKAKKAQASDALPAARRSRAGAPWQRGQSKGRRTRTTPSDHPWSW
jgi:hypothetical protein